MATPTIQQLLAQMAADTHVVNLPSNFQRSNANVHSVANNSPFPVAKKAAAAKGSHPGLFHQILDVLSRPMHASAGQAGALIEDIKHGNPLKYAQDITFGSKDAVEGLTGKSKKRYRDVIGKDLGYNGPGAGTAGFLGDVLLDPTTYIGGAGAFSKFAKAGEVAADAGKAAKALEAVKGTGRVAGELSGVSPIARGVTKVGKASARVVKGKAATADEVATAVGKAVDAAKPSIHLPANLDKAKPRYNYGNLPINLKFEDGIGKALYIVGGKGASAKHQGYLDFLHQHMDPAEVQKEATKLREFIKSKAKNSTDVTVPAWSKKITEKPVTKIAQAIRYDQNQGISNAEASLFKLLSEHPKPGQFGTPEVAKAVEKVKTVAADTRPLAAKSFDEIKNSLTEEQKQSIIDHARKLSKAKFNASPLSKLSVDKGGFKDFSYSDIVDDPTLAKSLFNHPQFREAHLKSVTDAKAAFLKQYNKGRRVAQAEDVAKAIEDGTAAAPTAPLDQRLAGFDALPDSEKEIVKGAVAKSLESIKANENNGGYFSATDQVNLRNRIADAVHAEKASTGGVPKKMDSARVQKRITDLYRHAEALIEQEGHVPAVVGKAHVGHNGPLAQDLTPLRLSNILPHLKPSDIVQGQYLTQVMHGNALDPRVRAVYNAAYAGAHIEDAAKLHPVIKQISDAWEAAANSNDIGQVIKFAEDAPAAAKEAVAATGASPVAANSAKMIIKSDLEDFKAADPLIAAAIEEHAALNEATKTGLGISEPRMRLDEAAGKSIGLRVGSNPENFAKLAKGGRIGGALKNSLGLERDGSGLLTAQAEKELGGFNEKVATVDRWFNVGFNSALGYTDLKAFKTGFSNQGLGHIADAQLALSDMFKGVSKADAQLAWRAAQTGDFTGPQAELAQAIAERMDKVFGETGILRRAGVTPDEYQGFLNRAFYAAEKDKPKFPVAFEHKNSIAGSDVTLDHPYDSWRHWQIPEGKYDHPARMMLSMEDAMYKSVVQRKAEQSLGYYFGVSNPVKGYVKIGDYHFPPEIAPQVQNLLDSFRHTGKYSNEILRGYDKMLNWMKTGFTKYMPSHHINNSIGQTLMAFNDGLTSPKWYTKSFEVLKGREAEVDPLGMLSEDTGKAIMQWKNQPLTRSQIWELGVKYGIRQTHAGTLDDLGQELKTMNRVSAGVQKFSNSRENFHRYAHFMFALSQSKAATLDEAARMAAARVNAVHGDYNDLTRFERSVMRRVIPFYTWQRKVGPIVFKQMITNPGRVMVVPKGLGDYAISQGADPNEPFPNANGLVPSYMTDLMQVPLGHASNGNQLWGGPRTPFGDVVGKYANHPVGNLVDSISPFLKLPAEYAAGSTMGTLKIPFNDKRTFTSHVEDSAPYLSTLKRITRVDPAKGFAPTKDPTKSPDEQGINTTAILNLLFGTALQENTQARQQSAAKEKANAVKSK